MLILIWSGIVFGIGFFIGSGYLKRADKLQTGGKRCPADKISTEKELTPEQQREAERLKKQMQNFFNYNGEEQEEIIV